MKIDYKTSRSPPLYLKYVASLVRMKRTYLICLLVFGILLLLTVLKFQQQPYSVFEIYEYSKNAYFNNISSRVDVKSFFDSSTNEPSLILIWTNYFGRPMTFAKDLFRGCAPELNCLITFDRKLVNESSAIIFHIRDFEWSDIPNQYQRRRDQYYVFFLMESPHYTWLKLASKEQKEFFNLTMTYRRDSDVYRPYGEIRKLPLKTNETDLILQSQKNLTQIANGKRKIVAWFVSHCNTPSRRERFVAKLKDYLTVDVYGKCGRLKCISNADTAAPSFVGSNCDRLLTEEYKFVLSLENSLCRDYVTEKFYLVLRYLLVVPVVMKRKLILDTIIDREMATAMNRSFIAVDDFINVQQMAEYLSYLHRNLTAYMEYFQWRHNYQVVAESTTTVGCDLCRRVKEKKTRIINNVDEWWNREARCNSYRKR